MQFLTVIIAEAGSAVYGAVKGVFFSSGDIRIIAASVQSTFSYFETSKL